MWHCLPQGCPGSAAELLRWFSLISMVISMMFCWGLWWFMVSYAGLWWCIEIHADLLRFKALKVSRYVAPLGLNMSRKYAHQRDVFFCFLADKILGKFATRSHTFPRCLSWAGKPGVRLWPRRAPQKNRWLGLNLIENQHKSKKTWLNMTSEAETEPETASLNYSLQPSSPQHTSTTELPVHILSIVHQDRDGRRLSLGGRFVQRSQAVRGRTHGRGGPQQRHEEHQGSHDLSCVGRRSQHGFIWDPGNIWVCVKIIGIIWDNDHENQ